MAGWVRFRGTLQVRPCKLGRRIHAAHAPATGPTPPSTDLRDLSALHSVDPRHAWMLFVRLSKYSNSMEIHPRMAWIYQIAEICQRWGGVGVRGVSRMGPRHASGGLGRTPNPGLAVCAGKRTRASGCQAYRDVLAASPHSDTAPPTHGMHAVAVAAGQRPALPRVQGRRPCRPTHYLAAAICFSMSAAVTGPRKLCASLPCGSMRCVSGRPRGVAKSAGGSNGSTITIG